jgi:hypothetical protein
MSQTRRPVRLTHTVKALLSRPVAFHVALARVCNSAIAGLMLSQAIYWSEVLERTNPSRNGWFYKTREEWADEIHLSRWEQEAARTILRKLGFWQEELRGVPAQIYFRVDMQRLALAISQLVVVPPAGLRPHSSRRQNHQQGGDGATSKVAVVPPAFHTETTQETIPEITGGSATSALLPPSEPNVFPNPLPEDWDIWQWSEQEQDWVCDPQL